MINIKTDVALKTRAQKTAKELGVPLSVVVNQYLRQFVSEGSITFSKPLAQNAKTRKMLNEALADIRKGKNLAGPFKTAEEMIARLKS